MRAFFYVSGFCNVTLSFTADLLLIFLALRRRSWLFFLVVAASFLKVLSGFPCNWAVESSTLYIKKKKARLKTYDNNYMWSKTHFFMLHMSLLCQEYQHRCTYLTQKTTTTKLFKQQSKHEWTFLYIKPKLKQVL